MDLMGSIISIYTYPTVVIFCEGKGIAVAKAMVEAQPSEGGLNFPYREDVRMYYRVSTPLLSELSFENLFSGPLLDFHLSQEDKWQL